MSKDYLAGPKQKSLYSHDLLEDYLSRGGTVQHCTHGESGGLTKPYKEMIKKAVNQAKRKRKRNAKST
jgi:hypothetical protein